jgi:Tfp pilus assembly protein PilX
MKSKFRQNGAVSLFIVIFAALLITIVTVSFVRIMIQNQQQSTAVDLSQSAYDSAQVGVEDAKRALLRYQKICSESPNPGDCTTANADINSPTCNAAVEKLNDVQPSSPGGEIDIQTDTSSANSLNQAYTCVTILTDTEDYSGILAKNKSKFIPLKSNSSFDTVRLEWFTTDDIDPSSGSNAYIRSWPNTPLYNGTLWNVATPPIMRTEIIQFTSAGFSLSDFDNTGSANTLFLYPSTSGLNDVSFIGRDVRRDVNPSSPGAPVAIICNDLGSATYACSANLKLSSPISSTDRAFMRLSSLYNGTNFRVMLFNGSPILPSLPNLVKFDGVEPSIDSTGRANDEFRRVKTRVEYIDANFPYPEAEIDMIGNFCKNFTITDDEGNYSNYCSP